MRLFGLTIFCLLASAAFSHAEIVDTDNSALTIYGSACEDIKADIQSSTTRMKATDKACFAAVSSLPEIVNIKDSFDDHDFNIMIYNIVDEYIEDMTTKTTKQDSSQICIEVSGYITPENIGKAIDEVIQETETTEETVTQVVSNTEINMPAGFLSTTASQIKDSSFVVLSSIFVRPTEFYNNTKSVSHSTVLKHILSQSENIRIVENENDADFIITPKVLKAKIESLNGETSRMQMVISLDTFDKAKNASVSEHQNKFILFNISDNEQTVAKSLLKELLEKGSASIIKMAEKRDAQLFNQQTPPVISAEATGSRTTTSAGAAAVSDE